MTGLLVEKNYVEVDLFDLLRDCRLVQQCSWHCMKALLSLRLLERGLVMKRDFVHFRPCQNHVRLNFPVAALISWQ